MKNTNQEVIVYLWLKQFDTLQGGRDLGSSADNYGSEFGWTAQDHSAAQGGSTISELTINISIFFPDTGQDILLVERLKEKFDEHSLGQLRGKQREALFGLIDDELFDQSLAGTFSTLNGKKVDTVLGETIDNPKIEFSVNGQIFKLCDYEIVDNDGNIVIKKNGIRMLILASTGFSLPILSEKFPQLKQIS